MSNVRPRRIAVMSGAGILSREAFARFLQQSAPVGMEFETDYEPINVEHKPSEKLAQPTEIELWNAAVDERRRAKQIAKKGYAK
jgi:hypothetical protein